MYGDQMGEFVCRYKDLKGYIRWCLCLFLPLSYSLALMHAVRYKMPHYDIVFLH